MKLLFRETHSLYVSISEKAGIITNKILEQDKVEVVMPVTLVGLFCEFSVFVKLETSFRQWAQIWFAVKGRLDLVVVK